MAELGHSPRVRDGECQLEQPYGIARPFFGCLVHLGVIGALLSYFSYKSILVYQYHTCTIWQPYGIARSFYGCIVHISFGSACDRCTTLVYYHTCTIWQPYGIARPFYGAPLVYHMIGALLLHLVHYYHTFMYYHTSLFYMQGRSMVACYHLVL